MTAPNYMCVSIRNRKKNNCKQLESKFAVLQTVKLILVYMLIDDDLMLLTVLELEPSGKFECIR